MDSNGSSRDLLPSRLRVLEETRELWIGGKRVFLLTGESGAGKTLLAKKITQTVDREVRWVWIDLTSKTGPTGFYLQVAHGLGLEIKRDRFELRLALLDWLNVKLAEGSRWAFVIEGAHTLRQTVAEELLILIDRLERGEGPTGIVLTGQTPALGKLAADALQPLDRRFDAKLKLSRINADEARFLLDRVYPRTDWAASLVDRLHCDAHGNPRELIRAAWKLARHRSPERILHTPEAAASLPEPGPLLGPSKKPLVEAEGLIEVGWDGTEDDSPSTPLHDQQPAESSSTSELDERVDDHYAALQAWDEWAKHRGNTPATALEAEVEADTDIEISWTTESEPEATDSEPSATRVRLDAEEANAPFSRLFGRAQDPTRPSS